MTAHSASSVFGTGRLTASRFDFGTVPGLSKTIDVPPNSVVFIASDGGVLANGENFGSTFCIAEVALSMDGVLSTEEGMRKQVLATLPGNTTLTPSTWSMQGIRTMTPGPHTIDIQVRTDRGNTLCEVGRDSDFISIVTFRMQSTLTVIVFKL